MQSLQTPSESGSRLDQLSHVSQFQIIPTLIPSDLKKDKLEIAKANNRFSAVYDEELNQQLPQMDMETDEAPKDMLIMMPTVSKENIVQVEPSISTSESPPHCFTHNQNL